VARRLASWLRNLFGRRRQRDMHDELQFHMRSRSTIGGARLTEEEATRRACVESVASSAARMSVAKASAWPDEARGTPSDGCAA
jgi:hypothetical protein